MTLKRSAGLRFNHFILFPLMSSQMAASIDIMMMPMYEKASLVYNKILFIPAKVMKI